MHCIYRNKIIL